MSTAYAIPQPAMFLPDPYQLASGASDVVQDAWERSKHFLQGSASDWLAAVQAQLNQIALECSKAGWDGPDSSPISEGTIEFAAAVAGALFAALPKGSPVPDLIPEFDGDICFEWTTSDPRHTFAMSLGVHRKINFAGRFGSLGERHGLQPVGENLDYDLADVVQAVKRFFRSTAQDRIK